MTLPALYAGISCLFVGFVAARVASAPGRASFAGFAGLGLLLGLVIGLSASPVLGTTLTAGFALAGTLVQAYLATKAPAPGGAAASPPSGEWLFPFCIPCVLGLIAGIGLRVNDTLKVAPPEEENLRVRYAKQGFNAEQVESILAAMARNLQSEKPPTPEVKKAVGGEAEAAVASQHTNLQSLTLPASVDREIPVVEGLFDDPGVRLVELKKRVPVEVRDMILSWEPYYRPETIWKALKRQKP